MSDLSPRLVQVMDLMCEGLTNAEIAGRMGLSENTIRNHVTLIYRRLGVVSRGQAMSLWLANPNQRAATALVAAHDALTQAAATVRTALDAVEEKT